MVGQCVRSEVEVAPLTSDLSRLAEWLRVLGEPSRLQIFQLLQQGTYCNCELGKVLCMAPNLISHHLRVLREAGLITAERDPRDARWVYYSVNRQALEALHHMCGELFDPRRLGERRPSCGPRNEGQDEEAPFV